MRNPPPPPKAPLSAIDSISEGNEGPDGSTEQPDGGVEGPAGVGTEVIRAAPRDNSSSDGSDDSDSGLLPTASMPGQLMNNTSTAGPVAEAADGVEEDPAEVAAPNEDVEGTGVLPHTLPHTLRSAEHMLPSLPSQVMCTCTAHPNESVDLARGVQRR